MAPLIVIMLVFASASFAIIPNADLDADRFINIDESAALGSGYDFNLKLNQSLAVGYKYYYGSFFSWDKSNSLYLKYLLLQRPEHGFSLALFASSFNSEGSIGSGWMTMGSINNYHFSGTNFGPLLSLKFNDWLVLRGAYIIHNITSSYASSNYPDTPLSIADPNGVELSWLINQNFELNIGLSYYGFVGFKAKV